MKRQKQKNIGQLPVYLPPVECGEMSRAFVGMIVSWLRGNLKACVYSRTFGVTVGSQTRLMKRFECALINTV